MKDYASKKWLEKLQPEWTMEDIVLLPVLGGLIYMLILILIN